MAEVSARLAAAIGREVRYVDVAPELAHEAWLASGTPPYLADGLGELFAERRAGKEGTVFPTTTELLGRPATSFAEFAARNAAAFTGQQPPAVA